MKKRTDRRYYLAMTLALTGVGAWILTGCGGHSDGGSTPVPTASVSPTPSPAPSTPVIAGNLTPPYLGKVAFISTRGADERDHIFVMNPDGSQVTQINPFPDFSLNLKYPGNHFMSADGATLLLTFDIGTGSGSVNFLVNADGSNKRDITTLLDPTATALGTYHAGHVSDVAMNTDGSQLVFPYKPQRDADGNFLANASYTLVTMNADGSARTTRYIAPADQQILSPIFAPDGQTLYFVQSVIDNTGSGVYTGGVYRLSFGATVPTLVTAFSTHGDTNRFVFPQISINADGTKLAYTNFVDGSSDEIFVVNTDGTGVTRLTTNTALDTNPAFTIDGTRILFESYRDGNAELYGIYPDGTGEARLSYEIEPDTEPATRSKNITQKGTLK